MLPSNDFVSQVYLIKLFPEHNQEGSFLHESQDYQNSEF